MIMKLSRPVNKVIAEAGDNLAILVTRTRQLSQLNQILRNHLDVNLAPHCYIGNIERENLVILVDSAAWASKLRFSAQSILANLCSAHPSFANVKKIQIKILNQPVQPTEAEFQRPQMNEENAKGLVTLAQSVDDPDLQAALTRLANRKSKNDNENK